VISEKEFTKVLIPPLKGGKGGVRINGTNSKPPLTPLKGGIQSW